MRTKFLLAVAVLVMLVLAWIYYTEINEIFLPSWFRWAA